MTCLFQLSLASAYASLRSSTAAGISWFISREVVKSSNPITLWPNCSDKAKFKFIVQQIASWDF
ncbi:Uncharacterised protein [Vibrio cholerae]|nr:Uncharacterised protein [Vibrio cholerae]